EGDQDRHSGDDRFPRRRKASRQDGRVSVDEYCRQRPHHAARGWQGGRAREDAEGDFQVKVLPFLAAAVLLQPFDTLRAAPSQVEGQSAPHPPSPADFGRWERLVTTADHGGLSPDGRWLAYGINRTDGENELRVTSIADGATK